MKKFTHAAIFIVIIIIAGITRFYGNNWDAGYHLHPDERMLIMVAERINFFSNLNPDFFNYGSLPVYLLKGSSQLIDCLVSKNIANYDGMLWLGRNISTFLDISIIFLIWLIAKVIFKKTRVAIYSTLFYTLSFFAIQNSNFFIVDVFVNFFMSLLFLFMLRYLKRPSWELVIAISIAAACLLASKFTPIIYLPLIILLFFVPLEGNKIQFTKHPIRSLAHAIVFAALFFIIHFMLMPYAYLEHEKFLQAMETQTAMYHNPYTFCYTLQYVGTTPYLYYMKDIALWGIGPIITLFLIIGFIFYGHVLYRTIRKRKRTVPFLFILYVCLNLFYFIIVGKSAVKYMRYMLPLYPFFAIIAGYGMNQLLEVLRVSTNCKRAIIVITILLASGWLISFMAIYSKPHTRIQASKWMNENLPPNSILAEEHWDDRMPLYDCDRFQYVEMSLYDWPDDENKWEKLNENLKQADYVVVSSSRLYEPLQMLYDCNRYERCYPITNRYYKKLFKERLGFVKIAEFSSYPSIPFFFKKIEINDDTSDEIFTVYDHPKVVIFKKVSDFPDYTRFLF